MKTQHDIGGISANRAEAWLRAVESQSDETALCLMRSPAGRP